MTRVSPSRFPTYGFYNQQEDIQVHEILRTAANWIRQDPDLVGQTTGTFHHSSIAMNHLKDDSSFYN